MKKILLLGLSTLVSLNVFSKNQHVDKIKTILAAASAPKEEILSEEWIMEKLLAGTRAEKSEAEKLS